MTDRPTGDWRYQHLLAGFLLVAFAAFMPVSAQAEMRTIAAFKARSPRGTTTTTMEFVEGASQGTHLAAIIADNKSASQGAAAGVNRIVVVFDKQTWPLFEQMWRSQLLCLELAAADRCPPQPYSDKAEKTQLFMYITLVERSLMLDLVACDTHGQCGTIGIDRDDQQTIRRLRDAIKTVSDYLNGTGQPPPQGAPSSQ